MPFSPTLLNSLRKSNPVNFNELGCSFLIFLIFKCLIWESKGENNYILYKVSDMQSK